jgi:hypothetical protein
VSKTSFLKRFALTTGLSTGMLWADFRNLCTGGSSTQDLFQALVSKTDSLVENLTAAFFLSPNLSLPCNIVPNSSTDDKLVLMAKHRQGLNLQMLRTEQAKAAAAVEGSGKALSEVTSNPADPSDYAAPHSSIPTPNPFPSPKNLNQPF